MVDKYNGDYHVKHFSCLHQLLTLMFGQLSGRESLRDLTTVLDAHRSKCYHPGLGSKPATRNTPAVAKQNRDYRIFEEFALFMMAEGRKKCAMDIFMLEGKTYAFDSTTIPQCLSVYCLVAIVRDELKLKRSIYELLQILGISLTDKILCGSCLRSEKQVLLMFKPYHLYKAYLTNRNFKSILLGH